MAFQLSRGRPVSGRHFSRLPIGAVLTGLLLLAWPQNKGRGHPMTSPGGGATG